MGSDFGSDGYRCDWGRPLPGCEKGASGEENACEVAKYESNHPSVKPLASGYALGEFIARSNLEIAVAIQAIHLSGDLGDG